MALSGLFRDIFLLEKFLTIEPNTEKVIKKLKFYELGKQELINRIIIPDLLKEKNEEKLSEEKKKWRDYLNILKDIEKKSNDSKCKINNFL